MADKDMDNVNVSGGTPQDKEEPAGEKKDDLVMDAEEIAEAEDGTGEAGDEKNKKIFRKKDKKDRQIDELNGKVEELTDRVKRSMAEFDNYRKRTEKEKAATFEMGERAVIEKVLPIVDNFERGLATIPEENRSDAFVTGMDKVYQQLTKTLEDLGVTPIEAVGQPFDPNLHNAVMHVEDENYGENIVVEEFQKGYMQNGTVVRHSMVKVAN